MSIKLTDTQIVMLSAAAQRDDRCLLAPRNLKGGAAQKVAGKLIDRGLAKEIKAKSGAPVWRRDEQGGQSYALKLTAAGARATADNPRLALDENCLTMRPAPICTTPVKILFPSRPSKPSTRGPQMVRLAYLDPYRVLPVHDRRVCLPSAEVTKMLGHGRLVGQRQSALKEYWDVCSNYRRRLRRRPFSININRDGGAD